ncbi:hypothetical protein JXC34_06815 [Candidatus Woesearchaeota archaeon]|nr:hypothetical protein [Candidatus Woesearchaeota archaeon]
MRKYTKEQLIHFLKKLSSDLKRTPTIKDMNKKKKFPSASTYFKRFGSWNNSLKKAGLKINISRKYDKKELIENLILLRKELARIPKASDLKKKKWSASYSTYRKYFGSWKNALKKAGISNSGEIVSLKNFPR